MTHRLRPIATALSLVACGLGVSGKAGAQEPRVAVSVVDRGPGFVGGILEAALASPHATIAPGAGEATLARGASYPATVVILGRDATVASRVRGDVIVVGGNLFVRPGAHIEGRAVAIGGTATNSTLAIVEDGRLSFRDETFDVEPVPGGGYALRYRALRPPSEPFALPGWFGLRIPTYDRVNGVTLPYAPSFTIDSGRIVLEPGVAYRSHLGAFDPYVEARMELGRRSRAELWAGRGTFSNDRWIYGDLLNSITSLGLGLDTRNWFRAGRAEARVHRKWEGPMWQHEPFVGARWERAWSTGFDSIVPSAPWSVFGRSDERMRRPNPRIDDGRIASALLGLRSQWDQPGLRAETIVEAELAAAGVGERRFAQTTFDGKVTFPTFGTQRLEMDAHAVVTIADSAPRQRFAYLGGSGTLRTLDLLSQGGDQLVFLESRYVVPLTRPVLPFLGQPVITLIHAIGGAGIGGLPRLEQELGVRIGLGLVRVEVFANPARGGVHTSIGLAFGR